MTSSEMNDYSRITFSQRISCGLFEAFSAIMNRSLMKSLAFSLFSGLLIQPTKFFNRLIHSIDLSFFKNIDEMNCLMKFDVLWNVKVRPKCCTRCRRATWAWSGVKTPSSAPSFALTRDRPKYRGAGRPTAWKRVTATVASSPRPCKR